MIDVNEEESASEGESSERPHLQAVRDEAEAGKHTEKQKRGASGVIVTLLCLSLIACIFVMFMQARQSERLEGEIVVMGEQIAATQTALAEAEAEVAGYETRMAEVRGSVDDLLQRVGALARLVEDASPGGADIAAAAQ